MSVCPCEDGMCPECSEQPWTVTDRGAEWRDPATRFYARQGPVLGGYGASSWSPEAAKAQVRSMQRFAGDAR